MAEARKCTKLLQTILLTKKVWRYSAKNHEVFETELFITSVSETPFFCHYVQITKRSKYEFSLFPILCIQKKIGDSS